MQCNVSDEKNNVVTGQATLRDVTSNCYCLGAATVVVRLNNGKTLVFEEALMITDKDEGFALDPDTFTVQGYHIAPTRAQLKGLIALATSTLAKAN